MDYVLDVKRLYENLFAAQYEKANIWPIGDADDGVGILNEEIHESCDAIRSFDTYCRDVGIDVGVVPTRCQLRNVEGFAVTAICELLQVIAVCRKYADTFEDAQKAEDEQ